jgi:hypothetical protein
MSHFVHPRIPLPASNAAQSAMRSAVLAELEARRNELRLLSQMSRAPSQESAP